MFFFFFSWFHCSHEVLMTLEFYAKDVRLIIILSLFIVIFNTNGWDLKKHRCSRLVKQFTNIKFCLHFVKNKNSDNKLTVIDTHPVIFALPDDNFFLFYFVFIGMLQGSSQVSGSTRIWLIGMRINRLLNWLHEAAMIVNFIWSYCLIVIVTYFL